MAKMPTDRTVAMTGITRRGKNKIAEAKQAVPHWDGVTWRVVQEADTVLFSTERGPWLEVMPDVDFSFRDAVSRWVHGTNATDFRIDPAPVARAATQETA